MPRAWTLTLVAGVLSLFTTRAAQTPVAAPADPAGHSPVSTNAAQSQPQPPKSVFVVPSNPQDGKDPFFPLSTRHRPVIAPATNTPPPILVELELKGISGAAGRRLAIINNRTFGPGEEGEVLSSSGRVLITCKEINADSVEVLVNGQTRRLNLRSKF